MVLTVPPFDVVDPPEAWSRATGPSVGFVATDDPVRGMGTDMSMHSHGVTYWGQSTTGRGVRVTTGPVDSQDTSAHVLMVGADQLLLTTSGYVAADALRPGDGLVVCRSETPEPVVVVDVEALASDIQLHPVYLVRGDTTTQAAVVGRYVAAPAILPPLLPSSFDGVMQLNELTTVDGQTLETGISVSGLEVTHPLLAVATMDEVLARVHPDADQSQAAYRWRAHGDGGLIFKLRNGDWVMIGDSRGMMAFLRSAAYEVVTSDHVQATVVPIGGPTYNVTLSSTVWDREDTVYDFCKLVHAYELVEGASLTGQYGPILVVTLADHLQSRVVVAGHVVATVVLGMGLHVDTELDGASGPVTVGTAYQTWTTDALMLGPETEGFERVVAASLGDDREVEVVRVTFDAEGETGSCVCTAETLFAVGLGASGGYQHVAAGDLQQGDELLHAAGKLRCYVAATARITVQSASMAVVRLPSVDVCLVVSSGPLVAPPGTPRVLARVAPGRRELLGWALRFPAGDAADASWQRVGDDTWQPVAVAGTHSGTIPAAAGLDIGDEVLIRVGGEPAVVVVVPILEGGEAAAPGVWWTGPAGDTGVGAGTRVEGFTDGWPTIVVDALVPGQPRHGVGATLDSLQSHGLWMSAGPAVSGQSVVVESEDGSRLVVGLYQRVLTYSKGLVAASTLRPGDVLVAMKHGLPTYIPTVVRDVSFPNDPVPLHPLRGDGGLLVVDGFVLACRLLVDVVYSPSASGLLVGPFASTSSALSGALAVTGPGASAPSLLDGQSQGYVRIEAAPSSTPGVLAVQLRDPGPRWEFDSTTLVEATPEPQPRLVMRPWPWSGPGPRLVVTAAPAGYCLAHPVSGPQNDWAATVHGADDADGAGNAGDAGDALDVTVGWTSGGIEQVLFLPALPPLAAPVHVRITHLPSRATWVWSAEAASAGLHLVTSPPSGTQWRHVVPSAPSRSVLLLAAEVPSAPPASPSDLRVITLRRGPVLTVAADQWLEANDDDVLQAQWLTPGDEIKGMLVRSVGPPPDVPPFVHVEQAVDTLVVAQAIPLRTGPPPVATSASEHPSPHLLARPAEPALDSELMRLPVGVGPAHHVFSHMPTLWVATARTVDASGAVAAAEELEVTVQPVSSNEVRLHIAQPSSGATVVRVHVQHPTGAAWTLRADGQLLSSPLVAEIDMGAYILAILPTSRPLLPSSFDGVLQLNELTTADGQMLESGISISDLEVVPPLLAVATTDEALASVHPDADQSQAAYRWAHGDAELGLILKLQNGEWVMVAGDAMVFLRSAAYDAVDLDHIQAVVEPVDGPTYHVTLSSTVWDREETVYEFCKLVYAYGMVEGANLIEQHGLFLVVTLPDHLQSRVVVAGHVVATVVLGMGLHVDTEMEGASGPVTVGTAYQTWTSDVRMLGPDTEGFEQVVVASLGDDREVEVVRVTFDAGGETGSCVCTAETLFAAGLGASGGYHHVPAGDLQQGDEILHAAGDTRCYVAATARITVQSASMAVVRVPSVEMGLVVSSGPLVAPPGTPRVLARVVPGWREQLGWVLRFPAGDAADASWQRVGDDTWQAVAADGAHSGTIPAAAGLGTGGDEVLIRVGGEPAVVVVVPVLQGGEAAAPGVWWTESWGSVGVGAGARVHEFADGWVTTAVDALVPGQPRHGVGATLDSLRRHGLWVSAGPAVSGQSVVVESEDGSRLVAGLFQLVMTYSRGLVAANTLQPGDELVAMKPGLPTYIPIVVRDVSSPADPVPLHPLRGDGGLLVVDGFVLACRLLVDVVYSPSASGLLVGPFASTSSALSGALAVTGPGASAPSLLDGQSQGYVRIEAAPSSTPGVLAVQLRDPGPRWEFDSTTLVEATPGPRSRLVMRPWPWSGPGQRLVVTAAPAGYCLAHPASGPESDWAATVHGADDAHDAGDPLDVTVEWTSGGTEQVLFLPALPPLAAPVHVRITHLPSLATWVWSADAASAGLHLVSSPSYGTQWRHLVPSAPSRAPYLLIAAFPFVQPASPSDLRVITLQSGPVLTVAADQWLEANDGDVLQAQWLTPGDEIKGVKVQSVGPPPDVPPFVHVELAVDTLVVAQAIPLRTGPPPVATSAPGHPLPHLLARWEPPLGPELMRLGVVAGPAHYMFSHMATPWAATARIVDPSGAVAAAEELQVTAQPVGSTEVILSIAQPSSGAAVVRVRVRHPTGAAWTLRADGQLLSAPLVADVDMGGYLVAVEPVPPDWAATHPAPDAAWLGVDSSVYADITLQTPVPLQDVRAGLVQPAVAVLFLDGWSLATSEATFDTPATADASGDGAVRVALRRTSGALVHAVLGRDQPILARSGFVRPADLAIEQLVVLYPPSRAYADDPRELAAVTALDPVAGLGLRAARASSPVVLASGLVAAPAPLHPPRAWVLPGEPTTSSYPVSTVLAREAGAVVTETKAWWQPMALPWAWQLDLASGDDTSTLVCTHAQEVGVWTHGTGLRMVPAERLRPGDQLAAAAGPPRAVVVASAEYTGPAPALVALSTQGARSTRGDQYAAWDGLVLAMASTVRVPAVQAFLHAVASHTAQVRVVDPFVTLLQWTVQGGETHDGAVHDGIATLDHADGFSPGDTLQVITDAWVADLQLPDFLTEPTEWPTASTSAGVRVDAVLADGVALGSLPTDAPVSAMIVRPVEGVQAPALADVTAGPAVQRGVSQLTFEVIDTGAAVTITLAGKGNHILTWSNGFVVASTIRTGDVVPVYDSAGRAARARAVADAAFGGTGLVRILHVSDGPAAVLVNGLAIAAGD